jgi:hypothetical protein
MTVVRFPRFDDNNQLEKHIQDIVNQLGVRGTPKFWINGTYHLRRRPAGDGATLRING